jgi:hypothetical protein
MPSYLRQSYRAYSYPPCIDSVDDDYNDGLPDMDEDPFSHFITPINEDEDPYDLSLSAGIMIPDGPRASKATKFNITRPLSWKKTKNPSWASTTSASLAPHPQSRTSARHASPSPSPRVAALRSSWLASNRIGAGSRVHYLDIATRGGNQALTCSR